MPAPGLLETVKAARWSVSSALRTPAVRAAVRLAVNLTTVPVLCAHRMARKHYTAATTGNGSHQLTSHAMACPEILVLPWALSGRTGQAKPTSPFTAVRAAASSTAASCPWMRNVRVVSPIIFQVARITSSALLQAPTTI